MAQTIKIALKAKKIKLLLRGFLVFIIIIIIIIIMSEQYDI